MNLRRPMVRYSGEQFKDGGRIAKHTGYCWGILKKETAWEN